MKNNSVIIENPEEKAYQLSAKQNWQFIGFSPLTPRSDQDRISPYNTNTISTRQVMRVKKTINLGIVSWSNNKFFELTL